VPPRRGAVVAPSLAAGICLALSLPPWGWWPLAYLGSAVLYWRLGGLGLRARLLAGWVAGLGLFGLGLFWIESFNWYGAVVLVLAEALTMALAAALVPATRGRLPAFVGAFTLCEALRMVWPFGGLPVGGVFLGQADGPVLAVARLGGPLLMTAVVWLIGGAAAQLVAAAVSRWRRRGEVAAGPSVAGVVVAAVVGLVLGALLVGAGALAPDGGSPVGHVRVAAVQGGGRRGVSKAEVPTADVFAAQVAATGLLGPRWTAGPLHPLRQLVVWPEDVISLDQSLAGSPQARAMSRLAVSLHSTVVAGVTVTVSTTAFRNEVVAWGPDGRIVAVFEKTHRVPFGEYVPYRGFFAHFASLSAVPLDAIPGHGTGLMVTPAGPLGVLVSYDVFYPGLGRTAVAAGARLLVVPTNTSSYAASNLPTQEVAAARVQAVANGRDLVQAAPTGYSTVVDNRGHVGLRTHLGARQVLVTAVSLRTGSTPYLVAGDLPVLLAAGLALAAGWVAEARGRRRDGRRAASTSLDFTPAAATGRWQPAPERPADHPRPVSGPRVVVPVPSAAGTDAPDEPADP